MLNASASPSLPISVIRMRHSVSKRVPMRSTPSKILTTNELMSRAKEGAICTTQSRWPKVPSLHADKFRTLFPRLALLRPSKRKILSKGLMKHYLGQHHSVTEKVLHRQARGEGRERWMIMTTGGLLTNTTPNMPGFFDFESDVSPMLAGREL